MNDTASGQNAVSARTRKPSTPDGIVDAVIADLGQEIVLGLPLGLGKANHLANAFYARAKADPSLKLTIFTALTLERPTTSEPLGRRLLGPIAERLYDGYPDLDYALDRRTNKLPPNVTVQEFYLAPGQYLGTAYAQQNYISVNYTHAVSALISEGVNVIAQMVAPDRADADRFSLSSNTDLTLDIADTIREMPERRLIVLGEINRHLPFFEGDAVVPRDCFDHLFDAGSYTLFPTVNEEVSLPAYALGLFASALVKDGGTLQLGIGALADAVGTCLTLRHRNPTTFAKLLDSLDGAIAGLPPALSAQGGRDRFEAGLYGCSEMVPEPLVALLQEGILKRTVYDDADLQDLADEKPEVLADPAQLAKALADRGRTDWSSGQEPQGINLHGGFYLGPPSLYHRLETMPPEQKAGIQMTRISKVNQLYGDEALRRRQRRHARFINTTMKISGLGAAISDTLAGGRVVSGVGGQYNFVAMAHELEDARSILLVRAVRHSKGELLSNIVWQDDGEVTIPRHLRDVVVTEYGAADLRGKSDREVVIALAGICDSRFQEAFLNAAKKAGKLEAAYQLPDRLRNNLPETLESVLRPARKENLLPPFPYGTPLTPVEVDLRHALDFLQARTATATGKARLILQAVTARANGDRHWPEHLARMGLDHPSTAAEWVQSRLVREGLRQTSQIRKFEGASART